MTATDSSVSHKIGSPDNCSGAKQHFRMTSTSSVDRNEHEEDNDVFLRRLVGEGLDLHRARMLLQNSGLLQNVGGRPVSHVDTERASVSENTAAASTITEESGKPWFRRVMREGVYPMYKFICCRDRKYDSHFCKAVFAAVGEQQCEERWEGSLRKQVEMALNCMKATDCNRVKDAFDGKCDV